jgi:hypothetical protein
MRSSFPNNRRKRGTTNRPTSTWAPAPVRPYRQRYAAACCTATTSAAGSLACRNAIYLHVHHIQLRSENADNLVTVCSAHHRALHRGELRIQGDIARLRVVHADGRAYGEPVTAGAVDLQTKVFSGLRGLGFREGEVRAVMGELRRCKELEGATAAEWVREALRRLRPSRRR